MNFSIWSKLVNPLLLKYLSYSIISLSSLSFNRLLTSFSWSSGVLNLANIFIALMISLSSLVFFLSCFYYFLKSKMPLSMTNFFLRILSSSLALYSLMTSYLSFVSCGVSSSKNSRSASNVSASPSYSYSKSPRLGMYPTIECKSGRPVFSLRL